MPEPNQVKWVGIRPTNPEEAIPVKQGTPGNLLGIISQYKATPPTLTDLDYHPVLLDVNGRIIISPITHDTNMKQVGGTTLTGRDISLDLKTLRDNSVVGILKSLETYLRSLNGDTGTQITKSGSGAPATTTIIHTVTAGKTLYLTTISLYSFGGDVGTVGRVKFRDTNDVDVASLLGMISNSTTSSFLNNGTYLPPIKIPAGYDICITSDTSGPNMGYFIFGWEE